MQQCLERKILMANIKAITDLFPPERLTTFLDRVALLINAPVFLLDSSGTILQHSRAASEVSLAEERVLKVPIHVLGEVGGFVVSPSDGKGRQEGQRAGLHLLREIFEIKAYSEYEIDNLSHEILDKYEEVNVLYDISEALSAVFDEQQIYDIALDKALQVIGAERASVMILDEQSQYLRVAAARGVPEEEIRDVIVPLGQGISGFVAATGEPLLVEDVDRLPPGLTAARSGSYKTPSFMSVPLICSPIKAKDKKIGVINLTDKISGKMFTTGDLKLLTAIASLAAIAIYNSRLVERVRDSERLQRDLEIAEAIQKSLLPQAAPKVPGVSLTGKCVATKNVGGDYFDFFPHPDGSLGLVIADVSGHGVGSAIMMAVARSVLRSITLQTRSPREVLQAANGILFRDLDNADLFISMFYAHYDPQAKKLAYANAGHNPPLLWREGQQQWMPLEAEGMLVGVMEKADYEERCLSVEAGDLLVLYTDGLVEACPGPSSPRPGTGMERNPEEWFGQEGLQRAIARRRGAPVEEILGGAFEEVMTFLDGKPAADDMTMICLKVDDGAAVSRSKAS